MIAFHILWRPIYRYGILYAVSFVGVYAWLTWRGTSRYIAQFPRVQYLLSQKLDDFMIVGMLWVLLGGRLGHVFLYEWSYYREHLIEIFAFHQWGMAFLGGLIVVIVALIWYARRQWLKRDDMLVVSDLIFAVLPLSIGLGRLVNYLNQELPWAVVASLAPVVQQIAQSLHLVTMYPRLDEQLRVQSNFLQAWLEGFLIFWVILIVLLIARFRKQYRAGTITMLFILLYAAARVITDRFKEIPVGEHLWVLTVTQWIALGVFMIGIVSLSISRRTLITWMLASAIGIASIGSGYTRDTASLLGNVDPVDNVAFTRVDQRYASKLDQVHYLRSSVYDAFLLMNDAFRREYGYDLKMVSAFRTFDDQQKLRDSMSRLRLTIVALPGTSQHHCCAIDIYKDPARRSWEILPRLLTHGPSFGFVLPYLGDHPYPYEQEDWHFVYEPMLMEYKQWYYYMISNELLDTLNQTTTAQTIDIKKNYVLGKDYDKIVMQQVLAFKQGERKQRLQFFSNLKSAITATRDEPLVTLGTDADVSYYQLYLSAGQHPLLTLKSLVQRSDDFELRFFRKGSTGKLLQINANSVVKRARVLYVIVEG